jgi:Tfp pilus assembly protein PilF
MMLGRPQGDFRTARPEGLPVNGFNTLAVAVALTLLSACVGMVEDGSTGVVDLVERPAERALMGGLRAYEDAAYPDAEKQLNQALQLGLRSNRDRAATHKHLAFIYCTSNRNAECETSFRAARAADPNFVLSKSEAGHPQWGPVYRRLKL